MQHPGTKKQAGETRKTRVLRVHPKCALVPEMTGDEYRALVRDIAERGVSTPLDVDHEGRVVDGRHRLRAARDLGLADVPVRTVSPDDVTVYVVSAAIQRRQLSASQRAALVVELEQYKQWRANGTARKRANLKQNADVATLPHRNGRTRDRAAELASVSPRLVQQALTVQAEPELFAQVKAGTVTLAQATRVATQRKHKREKKRSPRLPAGTFDLIYADPPWQLGFPHSDYAPEQYYPTLPLEEIKDLAVPAHDDAVLFLWVVPSNLQAGLDVVDAWGFEYRSQLVWDKQTIGMGVWLRNQHELLFMARRGNYPAPKPKQRVASILRAPRGGHSAKPRAAYELIERMYPKARKLELFARGRPRHGWTAWGNEVE